MEGSEGLPKGLEGLSEGSEGLPERPDDLPQGPEGQPGGLGGRMDIQTEEWTEFLPILPKIERKIIF